MVCWILLVGEPEFELEGVNFDPVLPREVLQNGRQETLREEEAGQPEHFRLLLLIDPALQALNPHV